MKSSVCTYLWERGTQKEKLLKSIMVRCRQRFKTSLHRHTTHLTNIDREQNMTTNLDSIQRNSENKTKEHPMKSNTYLFFNGQCAAAFKFYEQCLGGKITSMMTYGDSPMAEQASSESRDSPVERLRQRIMNVILTVGDVVLMGSDAPPENFSQPQGFDVNLEFDNVAEGERVFNALAENGTVKMPLQQTFWTERWGMLVDKFGTPWMINCGQTT
jgi:PhnB protein